MNFKPWARGHVISTAFATEDRRLPKHALLQLKQGGASKTSRKADGNLMAYGLGSVF